MVGNLRQRTRNFTVQNNHSFLSIYKCFKLKDKTLSKYKYAWWHVKIIWSGSNVGKVLDSCNGYHDMWKPIASTEKPGKQYL